MFSGLIVMMKVMMNTMKIQMVETFVLHEEWKVGRHFVGSYHRRLVVLFLVSTSIRTQHDCYSGDKQQRGHRRQGRRLHRRCSTKMWMFECWMMVLDMEVGHRHRKWRFH